MNKTEFGNSFNAAVSQKIKAGTNTTITEQIGDGVKKFIISSSGDVIGPANSVSGNIPKFADATGKVISDSGIAAANLMSGPPESADGRLVLFDGESGMVLKQGALLETDVPKAASNQLIQHGFAYIKGNGSSTLTKEVAFAQPFNTIPDVVPVAIGGCKATSGGTPENQGDFPAGVSSYGVANAQDITVNGFTLVLYRAAAWSTSYYYGASWIAMGTKARS